MIRKSLWGLAICWICFNSLYAQTNISGRILDSETDEPLSFANVFIVETSRGSNSNVEGFFTLLDIQEEEYTLRISYIGYQTLFISSDSINTSSDLVIRLSRINSELEDVVVTAESYSFIQSSDEISKVTMSPEQMSLLPSIGETDIFRSLQLLPGVSGTNENSSGLYIRGGTPDQNLVLLDGMTVYKVDHFFGFFSAFNANAIKDVQIYKGTFPAKYGGRTSSVVDLTGKSGSTTNIKGGLNLNLMNTGAYLELPIFKSLNVMGSFRRSYSDILQSGLFNSISDNLIGESDIPNPNPDFNVNEVEPEFYFYDVNLRLTYRPGSKDAIIASFYRGNDFLDESRISTFAFSPNQNAEVQGEQLLTSDVSENTDWGNIAGSLTWTRQWGPRLFSNISVAGSEYFSDYFNNIYLTNTIPESDTTLFSFSSSNFEDNNVRDFTSRMDWEWKLNQYHEVGFGVQATNSKVDYLNARNDTLTLVERNQEAWLGAVYLMDEWKPTQAFTFSPGLRLTYYENSDRLLLSPRASASYELTSFLTFKLAYGRHYQFVNRIINEDITQGSRDFWLLTDNELIDTGLSDNFVGGVVLENGQWLFNVETYYKIFQNLSEFSLRFRQDRDVNTDELFFKGDGEASGIEFLLQRKTGSLTGWVSYTLSSIANEFDVFNDGEPFPALHDQRHEIKLVQSYAFGNWNLSGTFIYGSGKPYTEPEGEYSIELLDGRELNYVGVGEKNGSRLPAYHRLDLALNYQLRVRKVETTFTLSLFNLYNRENIWYYEYDFSQEPFQTTEVTYLGLTPNLSLKVDF
ncbi:MAG: TonB-dependent receptor [Balneola sp.]|nr:MAG: TonB-dependent receptor [Balneola sp.]